MSDTPEQLVVAFGSCLKQQFRQLPAIRAMFESHPSVIALLGDNIYPDSRYGSCNCGCCPNPCLSALCCVTTYRCCACPCPKCCTSCGLCCPWSRLFTGFCGFFCAWKPKVAEWADGYAQLVGHKDWVLDEEMAQNPGWKPLVVAAYDDHDFGINNGGAEYPLKDEGKKHLVDFITGLDVRDVLRDQMAEVSQQGHGAYYSVVHEQAIQGGQVVRMKAVVLDTHYDAIQDASEKMTDVLGAAQWAWLDAELEQAKADADIDWVLLMYGTPAFLTKKYHWAPEQRDKMLAMIRGKGLAKRTLLLTGDLHESAATRFGAKGSDDAVFELIASSFTHSRAIFGRGKYADGAGERVAPFRNFDGYGEVRLTKTTWEYLYKDVYGRVISHVTP